MVLVNHGLLLKFNHPLLLFEQVLLLQQLEVVLVELRVAAWTHVLLHLLLLVVAEKLNVGWLMVGTLRGVLLVEKLLLLELLLLLLAVRLLVHE